jgi:hypothetical protein
MEFSAGVITELQLPDFSFQGCPRNSSSKLAKCGREQDAEQVLLAPLVLSDVKQAEVIPGIFHFVDNSDK